MRKSMILGAPLLLSAAMLFTPVSAQSVPSDLNGVQMAQAGGGGQGGGGQGGGGQGGGGQGGGGAGAAASGGGAAVGGSAGGRGGRAEGAGRAGDSGMRSEGGVRAEGGNRGRVEGGAVGGGRGGRAEGRSDGDGRRGRVDGRGDGSRIVVNPTYRDGVRVDRRYGSDRRYRGTRYAWGPGVYFYFYDGHYHGDCRWLRRKAVETGSRIWWQRFRQCRAYN